MDHSKILFSLPCLFSLLLFFSSQVNADLLNSDKQALLAFASALHHGKKLNWNSTTPICSSWIGVKCSMDQARVQAIRLPGMGLFGSIPSNTLAKLDALQILSLRSNRLVGNLPTDISSLLSLRYLYLQDNNFSGNLPELFSSRLIVLDLSYNFFTGEIPKVFQNLSQLSVLYLQDNSLSGSIPDFKLVGLQRLNLSYNKLNGSIPSSLQKFPNESFTGNSLLCGPPLAQCSAVLPSPSPVLPPISNPEVFHSKHKHSAIGTWAIIAIVAGGLSVLLLLVMVIVVCVMKKNGREGSGASKRKSSGSENSEKPKGESSYGAQNADKNKLSFFEGCSYNFDLDDLLRASAEILGKGTYGTSYKAVLEDGTMVVVKRLKEVVSGKREFEQQMEIIRRLGEHPNVLSIRAYYYSKEEKLLVYDFIPYGSFSSLLHGNKGSNRTSLDWDLRVKILRGVAHGIEHIHSAGGQFVHGNIKSSNVLVSQNFEACVSDFGLSSIMNTPVSSSRIAVGYHAPEVIETQKPTQKSDIYSFGVLLLEMLTGKSPLKSQGVDDIVDLPRWVQSMVREEWTSEVFDTELLRYPNIEEEMVQMLQFAMACVASNPERRPKIDNVISMIEEIWQPSSSNRSSSEEKSVRITA